MTDAPKAPKPERKFYRLYMWDVDDLTNGIECFLEVGRDEAWKLASELLIRTDFDMAHLYDDSLRDPLIWIAERDPVIGGVAGMATIGPAVHPGGRNV